MSIKKNDRNRSRLNELAKIAQGQTMCSGACVTACLVLGGKTISYGSNKKKTHPFQKRFMKNSESIYLHAETDCINNAIKNSAFKDLSKAKMYICRVKKDGSWGLAKPCSGCMKAIVTFGIREVYYSTDETGSYDRL